MTSNPFVSTNPVTPDDFSLQGGAEPIDQGEEQSQVFDDFFGEFRGTSIDIGAVEFVE